MIEITATSIQATIVPDEKRNGFTPKYFGSYFVMGESLIFTWMQKMVSEYRGGYWNFFELSNGGFYMAYNTDKLKKFKIGNSCVGGHTERLVSADAASIVACLYAMNYLLNTEHEKNLNEKQELSLAMIYDHYYQLRDYAADHLEAEAIFALID